jgi:isopropylmalate/homocitrate/citramalate synthase
MRVPEPGLPERVTIYEVGARDGLQNEKGTIPTPVKAEFVRRLLAAGLPIVEATSFVHPKGVPLLADADGVAEAELSGTEVEQPRADRHHLVDRDRTLPRVAEAHRDVAADVQALIQSTSQHRFEHRELGLQTAVEVLGREGLGGRSEDGDVAQPQLERPVQATIVGDQHRQIAGLVAKVVAQ